MYTQLLMSVESVKKNCQNVRKPHIFFRSETKHENQTECLQMLQKFCVLSQQCRRCCPVPLTKMYAEIHSACFRTAKIDQCHLQNKADYSLIVLTILENKILLIFVPNNCKINVYIALFHVFIVLSCSITTVRQCSFAFFNMVFLMN